MTDASQTESDLLRRIQQGDERALVDLFARHRNRLKRMVRIRLDRRLQGRVDPSDVIQEAHIEVLRRAGDYVREPSMPAFLWFRYIAGERLLHAHRRHLGTQMRDVGQEISLHQGAFPQATSVSLAALLLGRITSPTRAAHRAEMQLRLQTVLNQMDPLDREVLTLRHFEELSNSETARVLKLEKTAASNRYIRALKRLKDVLATMPGFFEP
jgi:RNA polymerase sigma-70 factor (ECF subfamily)